MQQADILLGLFLSSTGRIPQRFKITPPENSTSGMLSKKSTLKISNAGSRIGVLQDNMLSFKSKGVQRVIGVTLACLGIAALALHFWPGETVPTLQAGFWSSEASDAMTASIVPPHDLDPNKIALGRKLFHDARLSHNGQISCANCHNLQTGGTDGRPRSIGINGTIGIINAPTVFNTGFNFSQFWDGRAATLEEQVDEPLQSPDEMGSTWEEIIDKLKSSPDYVRAFRQIYSKDIRREDIRDAISSFERSLATPNSRFDRYLRHEVNGLTPREEEGYRLFQSLGCSSCHQGVNLGGNMYQKLGVMAPYFEDRGHITKADLGRFNVTGDEHDRYMFNVPTLRNVALTAPYFHDGTAATLDSAVRMMARYQLGRKLSGDEVDLIVEFLKTLTGELDGKPL
jgi:cytochrome c peroxidase